MFRMTIDDIEYVFKFQHNRYPKGILATTACLVSNRGNMRFYVAHCSEDDMFNKSIGRKVALGRALKDLFPGVENKDVRKSVWGEYFKLCKK